MHWCNPGRQLLITLLIIHSISFGIEFDHKNKLFVKFVMDSANWSTKNFVFIDQFKQSFIYTCPKQGQFFFQFFSGQKDDFDKKYDCFIKTDELSFVMKLLSFRLGWRYFISWFSNVQSQNLIKSNCIKKTNYKVELASINILCIDKQ